MAPHPRANSSSFIPGLGLTSASHASQLARPRVCISKNASEHLHAVNPCKDVSARPTGAPCMVAASPAPTTENRRLQEAPRSGTVFFPVPGTPDVNLGTLVHARSAVTDGGTRLRLWVADSGSPGTVTWKGVTYTLNEMHLHVPCENTLNGRRYPMEMHLSHKCDIGDLVLAVLFDTGRHNVEFDKFLDAMQVLGSHITMSVDAMLGDGVFQGKALTFMGGLKDPLQTPDLQWALSKQTVQFSQEQIERYRSILSAAVQQG